MHVISRWPLAAFALAALTMVLMSGCKEPYSELDPEFKLGNLAPKFDPPPLEEIEAKVEWIDQPVVDSMELLEQYQASLPAPEMTVEEALAARNTSPEINLQLRDTLGRLPDSPEEVKYDAEINRHIASDVKSTNPLLASSSAEFDIGGLCSIGLFGFDWEMNPFALAGTVTSWQTSKDGMYDKVVMRNDIYWSDGTPVTAHDVEYSYKVIMTGAIPIPAVRSGTDELLAVQAYDDHTLIYFHKEALATNQWNINFPIIPKHVYEETLPYDPTMEKSPAHVKLDRDPVVAGMYKIVSRQLGREIVLERRDKYFMVDGKQVRDKPHFKTIRFKVLPDFNTALTAMNSGDIDEMQLTPEQWHDQTNSSEFYTNNTKAYATEWVYFYFGWNCSTPFFKDKRVRWAMSYALDHEVMIDRYRYGLDEPSTGVFHPDSRWAPDPAPEPLKQDLAKAEQLLKEAGWEDTNGDGTLDKEITLGGESRRVPFEFTMIVTNHQWRIDICNLLSADLDKIGVKCNVLPLESSTVQDRSRKHEFQAMFGGWGTGADPDTSENLWTKKAIKEGRNFVEYANPEVDKLFEAGKRELDPDKREEIYQKIHMLLWEDQPYTWLFFRNSYYGFNKSLRGYNFSPRGPYNYGPGFDAIWEPSE